MPAGRPSKYSEAYCNEAIEFMALGYSLTAFAGEIGVNPDTCHEWRKVHPEFSDAIKIGQAKRLRKLETDLLKAPDGPTVTSRIFALKNAGPDEWRDKIENHTTLSADDTVAGLFEYVAKHGKRIHDPA